MPEEGTDPMKVNFISLSSIAAGWRGQHSRQPAAVDTVGASTQSPAEGAAPGTAAAW